MSRRFMIFGHRGSPRRFPENTWDSFEATIAGGADGFETDLRLLSDRTVVLYHDDDFADAPVESLTAVEIAERGAVVQRVSDLARFAGRTRMILEIKRSKWEDVLLDAIAGWPEVVIASFDHSTVAEIRRRNRDIATGATIHGYIVDVGSYAQKLGVRWVYPNYHFVDPEMVRDLHDRGIGVVPWTPNRVREWERLFEIGCDGIITDLPEDAVAWRASVLPEP
jgi:glycerophosphoryl diester phosphodiesterase